MNGFAVLENKCAEPDNGNASRQLAVHVFSVGTATGIEDGFLTGKPGQLC